MRTIPELEKRLDRLLKREDYEQAAVVRDEILQMKGILHVPQIDAERTMNNIRRVVAFGSHKPSKEFEDAWTRAKETQDELMRRYMSEYESAISSALLEIEGRDVGDGELAAYGIRIKHRNSDSYREEFSWKGRTIIVAELTHEGMAVKRV